MTRCIYCRDEDGAATPAAGRRGGRRRPRPVQAVSRRTPELEGVGGGVGVEWLRGRHGAGALCLKITIFTSLVHSWIFLLLKISYEDFQMKN